MSSIIIRLNNIAKTPTTVAISSTEAFQKNEFIWVWDHYLSFVLNHLSEENEAIELMEALFSWTTVFAPQMLLSFDELSEKNLLQVFPSIHIISHVETPEEETLIEVSLQNEQGPDIHIRLDENASPKGLSYSVLALAQLFLNQESRFYRELPLHIRAMRQFYKTELPFSDESSIHLAPAFAFEISRKFHQRQSPGSAN